MKNILRMRTEICVFLSAYLFIYLPLCLVFRFLLVHDSSSVPNLLTTMHFMRYLICTNEKLGVVLVGPCDA